MDGLLTDYFLYRASYVWGSSHQPSTVWYGTPASIYMGKQPPVSHLQIPWDTEYDIVFCFAFLFFRGVKWKVRVLTTDARQQEGRVRNLTSSRQLYLIKRRGVGLTNITSCSSSYLHSYIGNVKNNKVLRLGSTYTLNKLIMVS